jgi:hypothetical protein
VLQSRLRRPRSERLDLRPLRPALVPRLRPHDRRAVLALCGRSRRPMISASRQTWTDSVARCARPRNGCGAVTAGLSRLSERHSSRLKAACFQQLAASVPSIESTTCGRGGLESLAIAGPGPIPAKVGGLYGSGSGGTGLEVTQIAVRLTSRPNLRRDSNLRLCALDDGFGAGREARRE